LPNSFQIEIFPILKDKNLESTVDGKVIFHQEVKIKRGKRTVVEVRG